MTMDDWAREISVHKSSKQDLIAAVPKKIVDKRENNT